MLYLIEEEGEGTTEYALALAGIALFVLGMLMLLGPAIFDAFGRLGGDLQSLPH